MLYAHPGHMLSDPSHGACFVCWYNEKKRLSRCGRPSQLRFRNIQKGIPQLRDDESRPTDLL